jgi:hypothetical protein
MTTPADPARNSGQRDVGGGKPKKYKCYLVTDGAALFQQASVSATGAGGFEGEAMARADELIQAVEHQAASRNRAGFRVERRDPARDFIRVYELSNFERRGQASIGPSGLACAIGASNDDYVLRSLGPHPAHAARSATTASSTGKPASVTRSMPSAVVSTAPSSCRIAMRRGSSGRPASRA